MTTITMERIEKMTRLLATDRNVKPSVSKPSEESKKMDRLHIAREKTQKLLEKYYQCI